MSKILLVEDNPDAVKRIIRYINKIFAELDVVSFPEAGDALQYAKANDISLFIAQFAIFAFKIPVIFNALIIFKKDFFPNVRLKARRKEIVFMSV